MIDCHVKVQCPTCPCCGEHSYLVVKSTDLEKYKSGMFVQDAFPYLTIEQREMFMTGIHPDCWDKHIAPLSEDYEG